MRPVAALWKQSVLTTLVVAALGPSCERLPKLVSVKAGYPTIILDVRYAGPHNFVGTAIDGYEAPVCMLTPQASRALINVDKALRSQGYALIVYDCYRPQRAVDHFVRWAVDVSDTRNKGEFYPNEDKSTLFEKGYIAQKSSHSRGSTVDVGLLKRSADDKTWEEVDMGTPFDFFDVRSHTESADVTETHRENRLVLRDVMGREGFRNYPKEWWHYTLEDEPHPDTYIDIVVE